MFTTYMPCIHSHSYNGSTYELDKAVVHAGTRNNWIPQGYWQQQQDVCHYRE